MRVKYGKLLMYGFSLFFSFSALASDKKQRKTVFVIVDGIAYDMLAKTATPNIDYIAAKGSLIPAYIGGEKDSYSQTPTISAVGYNSLLTGTWVNKHNVWDNDIADPNYNYPTLFRLIKDQKPELKTAVFSTWEDNRTKLIGEGLTKTNQIKMDYAFDGLELDEVRYPHDNNSEYVKEVDNAVVHRASEYIAKYAPDLSWVYLQYTDDMGHRYGDGKELYEGITFEDELIGKLYKAVEYREKNFDEEWLFVVTTDHGRTETDGKHHGGQSDRERSIWILSNQAEWRANTNKFTPSVVDIAPSISDFMKLDIPVETKREWDGNSMFDNVEVEGLTAEVKGSKLNLYWNYNASADSKSAEIWLATTNHVKNGGKDEYTLLGKTDLNKEKASFKVKKSETGFYKVFLKSDAGNLNTWIL